MQYLGAQPRPGVCPTMWHFVWLCLPYLMSGGTLTIRQSVLLPLHYTQYITIIWNEFAPCNWACSPHIYRKLQQERAPSFPWPSLSHVILTKWLFPSMSSPNTKTNTLLLNPQMLSFQTAQLFPNKTEPAWDTHPAACQHVARPLLQGSHLPSMVAASSAAAPTQQALLLQHRPCQHQGWLNHAESCRLSLQLDDSSEQNAHHCNSVVLLFCNS